MASHDDRTYPDTVQASTPCQQRLFNADRFCGVQLVRRMSCCEDMPGEMYCMSQAVG
jgi:hypothetical protein